MRKLHDIEGRRMEPEKNDGLDWGTGLFVLVALAMVCGTVLGVVYILFG
jgi:hypothetical protein